MRRVMVIVTALLLWCAGAAVASSDKGARGAGSTGAQTWRQYAADSTSDRGASGNKPPGAQIRETEEDMNRSDSPLNRFSDPYGKGARPNLPPEADYGTTSGINATARPYPGSPGAGGDLRPSTGPDTGPSLGTGTGPNIGTGTGHGNGTGTGTGNGTGSGTGSGAGTGQSGQ